MRIAVVLLILTMCAIAAAATHYSRPQNAGLPVVQSAAPVCLPPPHWQFKQQRIA